MSYGTADFLQKDQNKTTRNIPFERRYLLMWLPTKCSYGTEGFLQKDHLFSLMRHCETTEGLLQSLKCFSPCSIGTFHG